MLGTLAPDPTVREMDVAGMVDYLKQHGYTVSKRRAPRSNAALVKAHVKGEHRSTVEGCSACTFRQSMVAHAADHYGSSSDADCPLCRDRDTAYLFPSRLFRCADHSNRPDHWCSVLRSEQ